MFEAALGGIPRIDTIKDSIQTEEATKTSNIFSIIGV